MGFNFNKTPPGYGGCIGALIIVCEVFFPGGTTMVVGLLTSCDIDIILIGLLQLLLAPLIVGWVWAIYWGFKAYGPLGEGGEQ